MGELMTVRGPELATLLAHAPGGVTTLSLDCFDTLLWRNVAAPRDVFAGITAPGGAVEPRMWAEKTARRMKLAAQQCGEVGLHDIYRRMHARASAQEVDEAVAHELALEARHCFAFAPAIALMRDAAARGLKIIIVSDMYLSEGELRTLLAATAGDEVLAMIDRIFMSSEHGTAKGDNLFPIVLDAIGARGDQVLHVGDNRDADVTGAAKAGLHAVHFQQFDPAAAQQLRMESVAATMLDPQVRVSRPAWQPQRAAVAMRRHDDAAYVVGHDVMGPAMHAFAEWTKAELDAMSARLGRPVRPLFLMRDGWLPFRAFDRLYPEAGARAVEISRLTAARAGLGSPEAINAYLDEWSALLTARQMARHLGLFGHEADALLKPKAGRTPDAAFARGVRAGDTQRKIATRSAAFLKRLAAHLASAGVQPGDAVMLVDVGYRGTVQNILTPVLEDALGLTVAGRYLFLREDNFSGLDKAGMIGTDLFDCRALQGLFLSVGVVEQMCNIAQGSTIDYAPDGSPIREAAGGKGAQNATRDRIQAAALDFVDDAHAAVHARPPSDDLQSRQRMAAAALARLVFLPLPHEVALFEAFDHDMNLGSEGRVALLDRANAGDGLRRRGLAYVNETSRIYVPGELAAHGLSNTLSYFASARFGLDLRNRDFEVGGAELPVLLLTATEQTVIPCEAFPTHDGYWRVTVPLGLTRATVAVRLGALCEQVQVDGAYWTPLARHDGYGEIAQREAAWVADGMTAVADGIFTASEAGVVIVPPPADSGGDGWVLNLIFRPLKRRGEAKQAVQAA